MQALEILKKYKEYVSIRLSTCLATDISNRIGISKESTSSLLRRLWKQGLVKRRTLDYGIEDFFRS